MIPRLVWITPPSGPLAFMGEVLRETHADLSSLAILYRRPGESTRARCAGAGALRELSSKRGVRFLTQDLELALCVGADGVHLPERGVPVAALRPHVGLLGASRHSREGLQRAFAGGADYCTLSPLFASPGKATPLGLAAFEEMSHGLGPTLALGGVLDCDSATSARRHGAVGAATIRGVRSAAELNALLDSFAPSS